VTSAVPRTLDYRDIQGNLLSGYAHPHVAHVFGAVSATNVARWRAALQALDVSCQEDASRGRVARNLGISHAGLRLLVPDAAERLAVFEAYSSGMQARAQLLRDPASVPWSEWAPRHVWIAVHAADPSDRTAEITRLQTVLGDLLAPTVLSGDALIDRNGFRLEPFGFRDDISQPAINGAPNAAELLRGGGKLDAARKCWMPIAAGEFLLGHPNERRRDVLSTLPALEPLFENGTFAVFRELVQDVPLFEATLSAAATLWRVPVDELKAKLIGRYADGRSLAKPDETADFAYDDDPDGVRCPLGAHVRRANPRLSGEQRIIRRGMPYRRPAKDTSESGADEQGLYFIAFNASIEHQFELIQSAWLNESTGGVPGSRDALVDGGGRRGRALIEGDAAAQRDAIVLDLPTFVSCRGGEYYFVPGLRGLQRITSAA